MAMQNQSKRKLLSNRSQVNLVYMCWFDFICDVYDLSYFSFFSVNNHGNCLFQSFVYIVYDCKVSNTENYDSWI